MTDPRFIWSDFALYSPDPAVLTVPALPAISVYSVLFWGVTNSQISAVGRATDFTRTDATNLGNTALYDDVGIPGAPNGDASAFYVNDPGQIGGTITWTPGAAPASGSITACVIDFGEPFALYPTVTATGGGTNPWVVSNNNGPFPGAYPPTLGVVLYAKGGAADVLSVNADWVNEVNIFSPATPQTNRQQIYDCGVQGSLWSTTGIPHLVGPAFNDTSGGRPAVAVAAYFLPLTAPTPTHRGRALVMENA